MAVTRETSCSADWPPNRTMRLIRSSATSGWYGLDLDAAGRFGRMRFSARSAAEATGGRLEGPDVELGGASFDSRTLRPGQLFVPIVAERDGHDFIDDALAAGAPAYLTARALARLGDGRRRG